MPVRIFTASSILLRGWCLPSPSADLPICSCVSQSCSCCFISRECKRIMLEEMNGVDTPPPSSLCPTGQKHPIHPLERQRQRQCRGIAPGTSTERLQVHGTSSRVLHAAMAPPVTSTFLLQAAVYLKVKTYTNRWGSQSRAYEVIRCSVHRNSLPSLRATRLAVVSEERRKHLTRQNSTAI